MGAVQMQPVPISALASTIAEFCDALWPLGAGVYVEAGANDGLLWSNTLLLERKGWSGLLVEPSPSAFESLSLNRPNNLLASVAVVGDASITHVEGTFTIGSLMGSADPELLLRDTAPARRWSLEHFKRRIGMRPKTATTQVEAKTFDALFAKFAVQSVDLLVLDVEGFELQALQGLTSLAPRIMVIETRTVDAQAIAELMLERGYVLCRNLSGFTKESHPMWSGDHQDLCWCKVDDYEALAAIAAAHVNE